MNRNPITNACLEIIFHPFKTVNKSSRFASDCKEKVKITENGYAK